jgi:hypothetical protein
MSAATHQQVTPFERTRSVGRTSRLVGVILSAQFLLLRKN